jgi:hypothetical protein
VASHTYIGRDAAEREEKRRAVQASAVFSSSAVTRIHKKNRKAEGDLPKALIYEAHAY